MFNAVKFIDEWAGEYVWREALANGETTVEEVMTQLRNLAATEEGKQPEEDEWNAIRSELQRHTR